MKHSLKIEHHISSLLYRYDCVIVPGLGGFVANYGPAKVHPLHHTFTPPVKNLVFNKSLLGNDGLLANHIAREENCTYEDAGKLIRFFVMNLQDELKRKEKVILGGIGTLFRDKEYNLQFEPDSTGNYLVESFGLAPVQSPPILRENIQKKIERKIEKKFVDRPPIPQKKEKPKIRTRKYLAYTLAGAAAIALLVIIPLQTGLLKNFRYSSLNPFADKATSYTPRTDSSYEFTEEKFRGEIPDGVEELPDSSPHGIQPGETPPVPPHKAAAESTAVAVPLTDHKKYHVVTGCFRLRNNADKFVRTLRRKGIPSSIIGQNDDGLYVVSSGDFSNQEKARTKLDSIRNAQVQAWLLIK